MVEAEHEPNTEMLREWQYCGDIEGEQRDGWRGSDPNTERHGPSCPVCRPICRCGHKKSDHRYFSGRCDSADSCDCPYYDPREP